MFLEKITLKGNKLRIHIYIISIAVIFIGIIYLLKANSTSYLLVLIAFLEGIATKMYELSMSKEFYSLSKKFEYANYNLVYELVLSIFRSLILLACYLFINDLKIMIYLSVGIILIGLFLKFKPLKGEDFKVE